MRAVGCHKDQGLLPGGPPEFCVSKGVRSKSEVEELSTGGIPCEDKSRHAFCMPISASVCA